MRKRFHDVNTRRYPRHITYVVPLEFFVALAFVAMRGLAAAWITNQLAVVAIVVRARRLAKKKKKRM